jgi:hypothetical protein
MKEHVFWKYQQAALSVIQLLVLVCSISSNILFQVPKKIKRLLSELINLKIMELDNKVLFGEITYISFLLDL